MGWDEPSQPSPVPLLSSGFTPPVCRGSCWDGRAGCAQHIPLLPFSLPAPLVAAPEPGLCCSEPELTQGPVCASLCWERPSLCRGKNEALDSPPLMRLWGLGASLSSTGKANTGCAGWELPGFCFPFLLNKCCSFGSNAASSPQLCGKHSHCVLIFCLFIFCYLLLFKPYSESCR